jgi:hypothetical protein
LGFVASDFRFRQFAKLGVKSILKIDLAARGNVSFWRAPCEGGVFSCG